MSAVELYPGRMAPLGVGTIPLDELASLSGVEVLQRVVDGIYPAPPMAAQLAFALEEVSFGRVLFRGMPDERHLNPLGTIHGGWAAAIMDSALGCAAHSVLEQGEAYTTAEFKVNLLRPMTTNTGLVECEGKVVHRGRATIVSEGRLVDAQGKLIAIGTETCSVFPASALRR